MFRKMLITDNSFCPFLIRITLGAVMLPHGAQKVLGWFGGSGFEKTIQVFATLGFPAWMTILLMVVEFLGAILLIAGFATRIWALGLGVSMTICVLLNHQQYGFFMNWSGQQQGEGFEYHLLVISMVLALLIKGSGMASIDRLFSGREKKFSL